MTEIEITLEPGRCRYPLPAKHCAIREAHLPEGFVWDLDTVTGWIRVRPTPNHGDRGRFVVEVPEPTVVAVIRRSTRSN